MHTIDGPQSRQLNPNDRQRVARIWMQSTNLYMQLQGASTCSSECSISSLHISCKHNEQKCVGDQMKHVGVDQNGCDPAVCLICTSWVCATPQHLHELQQHYDKTCVCAARIPVLHHSTQTHQYLLPAEHKKSDLFTVWCPSPAQAHPKRHLCKLETTYSTARA